MAKSANVFEMKPIKSISGTLLGVKEIFRQKRLENTNNDLKLVIGQDSFKLVNWSRTGLAFEMSADMRPFPVGLKVGPTQIFIGEIRLYDGDIEIRSSRPIHNDSKSFLVGAEFRSKLFMIEGIEAAIGVTQCVENLYVNREELKPVNSDVCKLIVELGSALRILKTFCDDQEKQISTLTMDSRTEATNVLLPSLSQAVKALFNSYNKKLSDLLDIDSIPENTTYHRLFEEFIYPFFKSADLTRRAFEKPRGYAGDFEMMNQMYRNGYEGTDLLGKVIHNYTANEDSSESVQYRRPYFINLIEGTMDTPGIKKILSIASGPAIEIQELVKRWPQDKLNRAHFTLFDLDRMALEHAQTKIFDLAIQLEKNPNVDFINASVKSFLGHSDSKPEGFDFVYSGGLFDYLDNLTSRALVQKLFTLVKPGGSLVIGNFTKENSTKAFCHLITRWHLIHKTEEEMREWAIGLDRCKIRIDYDPHHINAFIVLTKMG